MIPSGAHSRHPAPHPLAILASPCFFTALALLIANDWWLKGAWPGTVTGKLSDIAGCVALTLLLWATVVRRLWLAIALTAAVFTWWKLPVSTPAIAAWNALGWFRIGRVVDRSDLLCLVMLPALALLRWPTPDAPGRRLAAVAVAAVAIIALPASATREVQDMRFRLVVVNRSGVDLAVLRVVEYHRELRTSNHDPVPAERLPAGRQWVGIWRWKPLPAEITVEVVDRHGRAASQRIGTFPTEQRIVQGEVEMVVGPDLAIAARSHPAKARSHPPRTEAVTPSPVSPPDPSPAAPSPPPPPPSASP